MTNSRSLAAMRMGGIATEPGAGSQWHLRNTGQTGGTPGIDANVTTAWLDYTGRGVKIGIIDDGFELAHPDLAANFKGGWDSRFNDPSPAAEGADFHGTNVAGLIGADDNNAGLLGVAHAADLYGFRTSFEADATLAQDADALSRQAAMDVSSNSWAYTGFFADNFLDPAYAGIANALLGGAVSGRGGLGTNWVFAAGNNAEFGDDVNLHNLLNSRYVIAVAAVDANGEIAYFSNPGAALFISAPGVDLLTTDRVGSAGDDPGDTVVTSGTSFAAPIVAGVVALMLQANPNLGYRDVQAILAASARPIDAADPGWTTNGARTWNGGGQRFSEDYGYGLVDATAAVRLAETWFATGNTAATGNNLANYGNFWSGALAIPDADFTGVTSTLSLSAGLVIERVEVALDIQHSWIGDLIVELVSPTGTTSTLLYRPGIGFDGNFYGDDVTDIDFRVTSNAFRGEDSGGTWSLRVIDDGLFDNGMLTGWHITVVGSNDFQNDTYVYTDAFATLTEASRRTLADSTGIDTINAAAVTTASTINLETRTATIAGTALTMTAGTVIEHAIGGDGADAITGNASNNTLWGGRNNDTLLGKAGDDRLAGGMGNDLLDGATGRDAAVYTDAAGRVVVSLALAGAQNTQGAGLDTLVSIEDLAGSRFNDVLSGNTGANVIDGAAGNDTIHGSVGGDTLNGGQGTDTVDYRNQAAGITVIGLSLASKDGGMSTDFLLDFENAIGTQFADRIEGNGGNNVLSGLGGDDILEGREGIDRLDGGDGIDLAAYTFASSGVTVYLNTSSSTGAGGGPAGVDYFVSIEGFQGSGYNDTLVGNAGANVLRGGAGDDRLFGLDGDDTLRGGFGYDLFYGATGTDTADYADAEFTVRAVLGTGGTVDTINYGRDWYFDIENLRGGSAKDFLTGDGNSNRIEGNAGNDVIAGAAGNDTLLGGDGDDDITGGLGADTIILGPAPGYDIIRFASAAESRAAAMDRIEGFTQSGLGFDRIGLENNANALFSGVAASSIALGTRIELASAATLVDLLAGIVGLAASTATALSVTQVKVAAGAMAGSYVAVNDTLATFDAAADMLIGVEFASGTSLTAGNFFLF